MLFSIHQTSLDILKNTHGKGLQISYILYFLCEHNLKTFIILNHSIHRKQYNVSTLCFQLSYTII